MRTVGLAAIIVYLCGGPSIAAESAADVIKAFGLVGTWSIDCARDPFAGCDKTGCAFRATYEAPPSGTPMIKYAIGEIIGLPRTSEFSIERATRIADDRIRIVSIQQKGRGSMMQWLRQPGEAWENVVLKEGNRIRTYSARREDGKKVAAEDGFGVSPPAGTKPDELPTQWVRNDKPTPWFEKCSD